MSLPSTDKNVERYLGAIEDGVALSDSAAKKQQTTQADQLIKSLDEATPHLDEEGQKEAHLFRSTIDELKLQLALGKMDGKDQLDELHTKANHHFGNIKESLHRAKQVATDDLHQAWLTFKIEIHLLNLRHEIPIEETKESLSNATEEALADIRLIAHYAKDSATDLNDQMHLWTKKAKSSLGNRCHKFLDSLEDFIKGL